MNKDLVILNKLYDKLCEVKELGYSPLFIALKGSQNYEMDNENSDIDAICFVIPSIKDLFYKKEVSITHRCENDELIDIKDIRLLVDLLKKANPSYLEILFSKYVVPFNKEGKEKFKNITNTYTEVAENEEETQEQANEVETDGEIATYANYALEYFNYRCALSGEKFVIFDEPIQRGKNNKLITNLSAEHILALTTGGNDIIPNIVPSVYQYNIQKNGYYILDWWTKAKDINGNSIYTPEKLLKLVNYMLKSLQARKELGIKKQPREYRKRLLKKGVVRTPEYGHLAFSLPRFREFVLRNCSAEC